MSCSQHRSKYLDYYQYVTRSYGNDPIFTSTTTGAPSSSGGGLIPKTVATTTTTTRRYIINPLVQTTSSSATRTTTSTSSSSTRANSSNRQQQQQITNTISFHPLDAFYNQHPTTFSTTTHHRARSSSLNRHKASNTLTNKTIMSLLKFPPSVATPAARTCSTDELATTTTKVSTKTTTTTAAAAAATSNTILNNLDDQTKNTITKILTSDKNVGTSSTSDMFIMSPQSQLQPNQQQYYQFNAESASTLLGGDTTTTSTTTNNNNNNTLNDITPYLYVPNMQTLDSLVAPTIPHSLSYDSLKTTTPNQQQQLLSIADNNNEALLNRTDYLGLLQQQQQQVSSFTVNQNNQRATCQPPVGVTHTNTQTVPTEYRVALNIGSFGIDDINVQLVDDAGNKDYKKLIVQCYRVEPVQNSAAGNYVKKEFKRDILMPNNVDINTLETYFYNDTLTFTCKYKQQQQSALSHQQLLQQQQPQLATTIPYNSPPMTAAIPISFQQGEQQTARQSSSNFNSTGQQQTRSILKTSSQNPVQVLDPFIDSLLNNSSTGSASRSASGSPTGTLNRSSSQAAKSVRFDEELNDKQTEEAQEYNSALYGVIRDGFSCITKDSLENIYLTYFFKLPSCSPADRTQVKVENHSILRLKMIQEKKMKEKENTSASANNSNNNNSNANTNAAPASVDNNDKIMFREFSRRCRLPTHLFKFDDTNVTVSFMNDVWVRVEIPIIEFLQAVNHDKLLQAHNSTNPVARDIISKTTQQQQQQQQQMHPPLHQQQQQQHQLQQKAKHHNNSSNSTNTLSASELSSFSNSELISGQSEIRF